ncbi:MAG: aminomethyl-transferring glycine dehydrogenase subunit GcvPA [Armatimonadota bacterium]|nr:aminomethyl-transferring glycine dehydrogenase subunit GcvPA [Armatimonadota bacterium]MDR5702034.1 aminomethyl-transferring glycine dehydrogenase subunit GcvPA [Armatimonadota bacterium]
MPVQYIPVTEEERQEMLRVIGVDSIEALFADIPPAVRLKRPLNIEPPLSDLELWALLRGLADQNGHCDRYTCFLGAGAYDHYVPSVVWHLASRGEFLTAYTPYQAEIMQGELQAIYEYQTLLCELLAMDVANASMYDGASALAEATVMARDLTRRNRILVSRAVHPEYRQVIQTYTRHLGMEIVEVPLKEGVTDLDVARDLLSEQVAALVLQIPNFFGCIEDGQTASDLAHRHGALLVVGIGEPLAMGILRPPGEYGADIVAGEGQPLGNHLNFGGPYLGMMATRQEYVRRIPGRLVGATVDVEGRRGFVLTLQTREQHIRREKATSNICTNESLNALVAAIYMVALGKQGIQKVAELNLRKAHYAKTRIGEIQGFSLAFRTPTFHEFVVRCPLPPEELNRRLLPHGIIGGLPLGRFYPELADGWLLCVTETRSREEIDRFVDLVKEVAA